MGKQLIQDLKQGTGHKKKRMEDRMKWDRRTHMRKYRREDRMRWTRVDAEVACQGTDGKVQ